ncbi:MAG: hypothetical protein M3441_02860 [Chloroflexota bacterium]|nr:hypothetical protein [Chloroflexota bacterium]
MVERLGLIFTAIGTIVSIVALPESIYRLGLIMLLALTGAAMAIHMMVNTLSLRRSRASLQALRALGIEQVTGSGRFQELYDRISTSREIKIMAVSAETFVRLGENAIITALVECNCHVKVLIAKSGSSLVTEVERLEGVNRLGQIHTEIIHTRERLKEIVERAQKQSRSRNGSVGRIWIGSYESAIRNSMVICDNSWCWFTPYFPPKRAVDGVSLVLRPAARGLLEDCIHHFDSVWQLYEDEVEEVSVTTKNQVP